MEGSRETKNVRRTDMKECKRCNKIKDLSEFYKDLSKEARCRRCVSEARKIEYAANPEKHRQRVGRYRRANPEKIRDTKLKQAYGVGIQYYDAKLQEQGGVCAGCRRNVKSIWRGKEVAMALDHDHDTKLPRGILCIKCNRAFGLVEENIHTLQNLIDYKRKYQKPG